MIRNAHTRVNTLTRDRRGNLVLFGGILNDIFNTIPTNDHTWATEMVKLNGCR